MACPEWLAMGACRTWGCTLQHPPQKLRARRPRPPAFATVSAVAGGEPAWPLHKPSPAELRTLIHHSREERAAIFAAWLVDTFSAERLRAGAGVLDVAGGRGDVALALTLDHGVPAVLIDPKPRELTVAQQERLAAAAQRLQGFAPPLQICEYFGQDSAVADTEAGVAARACAAIVGLHPDQATDAIVEVALSLRRPFAVLPCCVYAQQHPQRQRPDDGGPVESYESLLAYLKAKHVDIRTAVLPFFGRNQVLYWLPSR